MKNEIAHAAQQRVVLLTGDEPTMRLQALRGIVAIHEAEGDEFDRETLISDGQSLRNTIGAAGTTPFLSSTRVAVLRNVLREDLDEADSLKAQLAALPESARLILVADEEANERHNKNKSALEKLVKAAGGLVLSFKVDPKKAVDEIRVEADRRGKKLSPGAARIMIDMVGGSYSSALEELDKLELYVGSAAAITEQDVQKVVTASREYNVYKLTDAIVARNPAEAMRQLAVLMSGAQKVGDAMIGSILPTMLRQVRLIYQARCLHDFGDKCAADFPEKPNFNTLTDWQRRPVMEASRKLTLPQIVQLMNLLSDADARSKGMVEASNSPSENMELLIQQATLV
ncbi:MAG: DNA polymerase III subunit delta [Chthonomonas sp.]|nr:DNA polymerase III subunit delta [Chthonomonas sp.]